jgi:hypothetical protein
VWYADHQPAHGDLVLNLNAGPTLTGGLAEEDWAPLVSWNHELTCDGPVTERHYQVARVAVLWVEGVPREWTEPEEAEALAAILSLPMADRKAWIGRYIEASNSCDLGALAELVAELR